MQSILTLSQCERVIRLFTGQWKLVCLLTGVLIFGEVCVPFMEKPEREKAETEETAEERDAVIWNTEEQIKAEYRRLEEEESETRAALREKEAEWKAQGETEQTEIMELEEKLRRLQLQKTVLRARAEEKDYQYGKETFDK